MVNEAENRKRDTAPDTSSGAGWLPTIGAGSSVKYTSIVDAMAEAISSGRLAEGERLPPHRELAGRLGVTVATVTKAIADLARRGLVDTKRGSGTFVTRPPGPEPVAFGPLASQAPADLAVNRPLTSVAAPFLQEALQAVAARSDMADVFGYEVVGGNGAHRSAGVAWLAERGMMVGEDSVLLTRGGNDGLLAAMVATCRTGEALACEATNYTGIRRLAQLLGVELVPVAMDAHGLRPDALEAVLNAREIRAVLCTPVTHNPSAASMDGQRRRDIAALVQKHDCLLIEDDIYGHLAGGDDAPLFTLLPERCIHITSLSKCLSAGVRAGFLAVAPTMAGRVRDALYTTSWTAPSLHAEVAARLILSGGARDAVAAHRHEALERVTLAENVLGASAIAPTGGRPTYHVWMPLAPPLRAEEVCAELQRADVLVSPARHFTVGDAPAPNAIRISLGGIEDRALLARALSEIDRQLSGSPIAVGAIA